MFPYLPKAEIKKSQKIFTSPSIFMNFDVLTRQLRTLRRLVFPAPEEPIIAVNFPGWHIPDTLSKITRVLTKN